MSETDAAEPERVHAYGDSAALGTSIECSDCGLKINLSSKTLPPCPKYDEETHARAGWLFLAAAKPGTGPR